MTTNSFVQLRSLRWLGLATYLAVVIMCALGLLVLNNPISQATSLVLGLSFAMLYRFLFPAASDDRRLTLYVIAQTAVLTGLLLLRPTDQSIYVFLYFLLSIQVAIVVSERKSVAWIVLFYVVTSASEIWQHSRASFVPVLFNAITFFVCGIVGSTVRQLEIARREKTQLAAELAAAQRQLQYAAVAKERDRLARDLHDSAKQQAFALSAQLDAARTLINREPAAAAIHLQQAEALADELRQELAGLILELRPPALGDRGLAQALRQYVADWSQQNNVRVEMHVDDPGKWSPADEQALFRVGQEALANIMRHSRATQVEVALTCVENNSPSSDHRTLTLLVADNGRGFDMDSARYGMGLESMRERLVALGGDVTVESRPGHGTRVLARLNAHDD